VKLVGLMPVRNEDWSLGFTLRVALKWCDQVCVLLHGCNDGSRDIVFQVAKECDHTGRVQIIEESAPTWDEMQHRQRLLDLSRACGATHLAIIDADEFLTPNILPDVRDYIKSLARGMMMELPGYNLRECGAGSHDHEMPGWKRTWRYHTNGVWGLRWFATAFVDGPALHWQGDQFHHREPFGCGWNRWRPLRQGYGGVMHLWGASERRLRAKHALYKITERLRWPSKTNDQIEYVYGPATDPNSKLARQLNVSGPWTFHPMPETWIEPYADLMQYLHVDVEPWQAAEVRSLLETHGREHFAGLDLLGY
jgi:hypothetical protein